MIRSKDRLYTDTLQRVQYRAYITGIVVNYSYHNYSIPFVLGNCAERASRLFAILIARANPLNIASILWCSLSPSTLILRLQRAVSEKDLKKW